MDVKTPQQVTKENKLFKFNNTKDEGYVYMFSSPTFKKWIKIGKTNNVEQRLKNYNSHIPLKNFKIECVKETKNKSVAELLILNKVYNEVGIKRKGEWIKVRNKQKAISIFNKHKNRKVTQKDRELNYANL